MKYKYRNGVLPMQMQYVFLLRSSAGCKKYVTRRRQETVSIFIANLHAIFNDIITISGGVRHGLGVVVVSNNLLVTLVYQL